MTQHSLCGRRPRCRKGLVGKGHVGHLQTIKYTVCAICTVWAVVMGTIVGQRRLHIGLEQIWFSCHKHKVSHGVMLNFSDSKYEL